MKTRCAPTHQGPFDRRLDVSPATFRECTSLGRSSHSRHVPRVYLAGPFFTLAQLWLIEQARNDLRAAGLRVFSPYHDVGVGAAQDVVSADLQGVAECDLVFAIGDGMDPGTVFEIGYARAMGKPVVVYCETGPGESLKMMQGTDCLIEADYVSAVYRTLWKAFTL
jgi:nucleoside 2-deoxyribosyltransferase